MTLLEAMNSGKKFRHKSWSNDYWMRWEEHVVRDSLGRPEEIINHPGEYEFFIEPIVWENAKAKVYKYKSQKTGVILVPPNLAGKHFKVRIEEIL